MEVHTVRSFRRERGKTAFHGLFCGTRADKRIITSPSLPQERHKTSPGRHGSTHFDPSKVAWFPHAVHPMPGIQRSLDPVSSTTERYCGGEPIPIMPTYWLL